MRNYLQEDYPVEPDLSFDEVKRLVVGDRLIGGAPAKVHAQMLSDLDRLQRQGRPVPLYAWLEDHVRQDIDDREQ